MSATLRGHAAAPEGVATPVAQEPLLLFYVVGNPAPQGSKRPYRNKKTERIQMIESSKRVRPWKDSVMDAALQAREQDPPNRMATIDIPCVLSAIFFLPRPKKPKFKEYPAGTPDLDKLLRAVGDAITECGILADDGRIVGFKDVYKIYAPEGTPPGVIVRLHKAAPFTPSPAGGS